MMRIGVGRPGGRSLDVVLGLVLTLAGCHVPPRAPEVGTAPPGREALPESHNCRDAAARPSQPAVVDRGIGGTGVRGGNDEADRGIGGTGIVGAVTGFGSVCVNGVEVQLDASVPILSDGRPTDVSALAVGDVVAVAADGELDQLRARSVVIRHEVSGPITSIAGTSGEIVVAGQRVLPGPATHGAVARIGEWVTVSGLRDLTGTIRATRISGRAPGQTTVAGIPERRDGAWWLGRLVLRFPAGLSPAAGRQVFGGRYAGGELRVSSVIAEPFVPLAPGRDRFLVEGVTDVANGVLRLGPDVQAPVGPGFGPAPAIGVIAIVEFVASPPVGLVAVSWHGAGRGGDPSGGTQNLPGTTPVVAPSVTGSTTAVAPGSSQSGSGNGGRQATGGASGGSAAGSSAGSSSGGVSGGSGGGSTSGANGSTGGSASSPGGSSGGSSGQTGGSGSSTGGSSGGSSGSTSGSGGSTGKTGGGGDGSGSKSGSGDGSTSDGGSTGKTGGGGDGSGSQSGSGGSTGKTGGGSTGGGGSKSGEGDSSGGSGGEDGGSKGGPTGKTGGDGKSSGGGHDN